MGLYLLALSLSTILDRAWIVFLVVAGLGLVVFVHELGHFLVAKACGVKCEKFYIGFDVPIRIGPIRLPRTLGKFTWGETEYGIGIIPLGGYVKMLGQDDDPRNAAREAERIRVQKAGEDAGADAQDGSTEASPADSSGSSSVGSYELDPRSFPAKTVPQRMAIISAGVIMNLIFAVIFAAIAYMQGVRITPSVVALTAPGDPAWEVGMLPGDQIMQIGRDGTPDDHLRFDWELRQLVGKAGMSGEVKPLSMLVRSGDSDRWIDITPTDRMKNATDEVEFVTLGVGPPRSTKLGSTKPAVDHMAAGRADPPLEPGDVIVGVNGQLLPRDPETGQVFFYEVERILAQHVGEPVTLTVERQADASEQGVEVDKVTLQEIKLPPSQRRTLGLVMRMGPVEVLQQGSPAVAAGFKTGDVIQKIDGEPVGDPMTLPQRVAQEEPREIEVEVERTSGGEKETLTLQVTPRGPPKFSPPFGRGARMSLDQLGLAYSVTPIIASVKEGSPAAKAGLKVGDEVKEVQWLTESEDAEFLTKVKTYHGKNFSEPRPLNPDAYSWPYIDSRIQEDWPELQVKLIVEREGERVESEAMEAVDDPDSFYPRRGLIATNYERIHRATSFLDGVSLGFRETREKIVEVLETLYALITFQVSAKNLVGPLGIVQVAGGEASHGVPRLLIFLTLLSANLAILNFLPIPALDGGHMMFLLAEAVTGKPVDERVQGTLTLIGVVCLLCLMAFVVTNDILR